MPSNTLPRRQRGAAALGVVLMLLAALGLAAGLAHRSLLFEQRSSANQLRSTRAFEAAEAGQAWAQAQLNRGTPIGADCEPGSALAGDSDFRTRYLALDAATGRFAPRSLATPGGPQALQSACVATDEGFACRCPVDAEPPLDDFAGSAQPAFFVRFEAEPRTGMVRLVVTGCDALGAACRPGTAGAGAGASSAQVQATLALLPALATVPGAALTARSAIDAGGALTLVNQDEAAGGDTARAGGAIALPVALLVTLPGRDASESAVAMAEPLAGLDAARLLVRLLGVDGDRWRALPGVQRVDCRADCATRLAQAESASFAPARLWIDGDLALEGPFALGSADKPVLLVVDGQLRLQGDVTIHGVVVTLADDWDTGASGGGAQVCGAVVALGSVRGSGTLAIVRDADGLGLLHRGAGHFARVAGGWRDF